MPFVASKSDPAAPSLAPPLVELTYFTVTEANAERGKLPDDKREKPTSVPLWQLKVPFGYVRDEDQTYFDVPKHTGNVAIYSNHSDLATIPGFLWGILAPFGRQMRPALLHDRRCDIAHATQIRADGETDPAKRKDLSATALATRKEADYLFRDSLGDEGVGLARRLIFWAGVSLGRFLGYQKLRGRPLAAAVAVFAFVALHAAALSAHLTAWGANRWIFLCPFWIAFVGLFAVALLYTRRLVLAAVLPLVALLLALVAAGTGPHDVACLHSWVAHLTAACAALLAVVATGAFTDVRVALIGAVISPFIVSVIAVTVTAEFIFALPDLRNPTSEGGKLGPIMPTLRWRFR